MACHRKQREVRTVDAYRLNTLTALVVALVSLRCVNNLVASQRMLGQLAKARRSSVATRRRPIPVLTVLERHAYLVITSQIMRATTT